MTSDKLRFSDKLLPNQPAYSNHFQGTEMEEKLFGTICRVMGAATRYEDLDLAESDLVSMEEIGSNPTGLWFLVFLLKSVKAKRLLEIGTFLGASAILFARALPKDGEVVTIEKFPHFAELAQRNFERNGVANKVKLLIGDAMEVIPSIPEAPKFDIIFIDGDKGRYKDYFIAAERLLAPDGIIIVDDCFFHGDVLNDKPVTDKGQGVRDCLDFVAGRPDLTKSLLPISNGMMLIRRA